MSELKIINEQEVLGKDFKVYGDINNPLFLAKDVATWIENTNVSQMLSIVDEEEKGIYNVDTLGGIQSCLCLTEDGLYEVLMLSRKPIAKKFKKKVKEILKTIRLTGGVVSNDEMFINTYLPFADETTKLLFKSTLQVINKQNELIEQQKPLVSFANRVASSSDTIDMGELSKLCAKEGLSIGRNRLFEYLRQEKILMKNNNPYQKYIDLKWFETIETIKSTAYGDKLFTKTLVTGLGQIKIIERLIKDEYEKEYEEL